MSSTLARLGALAFTSCLALLAACGGGEPPAPQAARPQMVTVQTYLVEREPDDEARAATEALFEFLGRVVGEEDLPTSFAQQRALSSGLLPSVCYGRNEGGVQRFHRWNERIIATGSDDLDGLFRD